jgi:hypothetical protein
VPGGGVEPPRAEARRILSPLRLPVPPSRLYLQVLILRPVYGSVPFSSKMTNVQPCKKVRQFPQTSTVHCHFPMKHLPAILWLRVHCQVIRKHPQEILPLS